MAGKGSRMMNRPHLLYWATVAWLGSTNSLRPAMPTSGFDMGSQNGPKGLRERRRIDGARSS
jgi:hypothetical protein